MAPRKKAGHPAQSQVADSYEYKTADSPMRPYMNWAGEAKQISFDVPTLPLFVYLERSTEGILETLKGQAVRSDLQRWPCNGATRRKGQV